MKEWLMAPICRHNGLAPIDVILIAFLVATLYFLMIVYPIQEDLKDE